MNILVSSNTVNILSDTENYNSWMKYKKYISMKSLFSKIYFEKRYFWPMLRNEIGPNVVYNMIEASIRSASAEFSLNDIVPITTNY